MSNDNVCGSGNYVPNKLFSLLCTYRDKASAQS